MIARETDHQRRLFVAVGEKKRERERKEKKEAPEDAFSVYICCYQSSTKKHIFSIVEFYRRSKNHKERIIDNYERLLLLV